VEMAEVYRMTLRLNERTYKKILNISESNGESISETTERLASLSAKGALMSAVSTFLNVQAILDLVDISKRKDVLLMYENTRKKGVEFMKGNEGTDMTNYVTNLQAEHQAKKDLRKKVFKNTVVI